MTDFLFGNSIWLIPLGLLAVLYLFAPLVIKQSQYLREQADYQVIDREHMPADVRAFFDQTLLELEAIGYRRAVVARDVGAVPGGEQYVGLAYHPLTSDTATIAFTIAGSAGAQVRQRTVIFDTVFEDSSRIETGNFADAGVFPPNPASTKLHIPRLHDVVLLNEVHTRRRERYQPTGTRPLLPPPGRELEALLEEDQQEKERVVAKGYYYLDEAAGRYRPTLKGAYLMTWKLTFPVGVLRRLAKTVRARRQLRELGLDPRLLKGVDILTAAPPVH